MRHARAVFYEIETFDDSPLLRIVMRGYWTMATFGDFMRDCGEAIQRLMARYGRFDMLSYCDDFAIQGPDVSAAFEQLKQQAAETPQNRLAIVTSKALGRMQAERLLGNSHSKIFSTEAAALAWLASPSPTNAR